MLCIPIVLLFRINHAGAPAPRKMPNEAKRRPVPRMRVIAAPAPGECVYAHGTLADKRARPTTCVRVLAHLIHIHFALFDWVPLLHATVRLFNEVVRTHIVAHVCSENRAKPSDKKCEPGPLGESARVPAVLVAVTISPSVVAADAWRGGGGVLFVVGASAAFMLKTVAGSPSYCAAPREDAAGELRSAMRRKRSTFSASSVSMVLAAPSTITRTLECRLP